MFGALGGAGTRNGCAQAAFEHDDVAETAEAVTEGVKNIEAQKAGDVNLAGGAELRIAHPSRVRSTAWNRTLSVLVLNDAR